MAKNVMKEYDKLYGDIFGVANANVTAYENGAQISNETRVKDLMGDLRKFFEIVKNNVTVEQRKAFKEAVKDYSNYYKKDENEIDFTIVDMNRKEMESNKRVK